MLLEANNAEVLRERLVFVNSSTGGKEVAVDGFDFGRQETALPVKRFRAAKNIAYDICGFWVCG